MISVKVKYKKNELRYQLRMVERTQSTDSTQQTANSSPINGSQLLSQRDIVLPEFSLRGAAVVVLVRPVTLDSDDVTAPSCPPVIMFIE